MDFKLVLLMSALGMTCAASIQDPYIHDSAEDQIAMESGPTHTVVEAPPHLRAALAAAAAAAPEPPAEVEADAETAEADADNEVAQPEPDTKKPAAPFTVLVNDVPMRPAALRPAPIRPSFGGFAVRRPALSPMMQLLTRLQQPQLQYGGSLGGYGASLGGYGASLGGYGASPIILLQPIIVPVPMSGSDAESQPNALTEQVMSSLLRRQPMQPRPLSLMDILQRGYAF